MPSQEIEELRRDKMISILCSMSDRQVEPCVKPRLQAIKGRSNAEVLDEFLGIIDDCVFYAWTSDFEIQTMHWIWKEMGGSEEKLAARNALLHKPTDVQKKELNARFKWQMELK